MTESDDDVKGLLSTAFGPEPPMTLDRDAVFRRGHRRVRLRRIATSGGVAASVVAVVVGAVALTGANRDNTDADVADPVPTSASVPSPSPDARAAMLTTAIVEAMPIQPDVVIRTVGGGSRPPLTFAFKGFGWEASADLGSPGGSGALSILVRDTKGAEPPVGCVTDSRWSTCAVSSEYGYPMIMATRGSRPAAMDCVVRGVRPDGTEVTVTVTMQAGTDTPPLTFETMKKIAGVPGLSV